MVKKQSLWFITLFSLILVLGVYYITMPSELFLSNPEPNNKVIENNVVLEEANVLSVMRVELNDEREETLTTLEDVLNNTSASTEEKNSAFEKIKYINEIKGLETNLESKILKSHELESFVKIEDNQIMIVALKNNHDVTLANEIMKTVQEEFDEKMFISVKFET